MEAKKYENGKTCPDILQVVGRIRPMGERDKDNPEINCRIRESAVFFN